jgi:hypothetical protein
MSFGFGISDFEYVFSLVMRVKNFLSDISSAPNDWNALRAEADCLAVCLKVLRYKQSRRILQEISRDQRKDLLTIIEGCELNMAELIGFVAQTQSIAISESGKRKPPGWSLKRMWNSLVSEGINLWTKIRFVNKDQQPMREKIAIPTQSLNIYLVSLTFISLSYNARLSGGPGGGKIQQPAWIAEWDVVGAKVAFKEAGFSRVDLMRSGVEDAIIECAEKKIAAGAVKIPGKKPAGGSGGVKVPKRPRRKSSFGPRVSNTDPDGMFLIRGKNRARSKARVNSSVEIVKADYEFDSDSGSESVGFDGEIISPRRPRSPTRGGGGGAAYEDRSPDRSVHPTSGHHESQDRHRHNERHNSDDEEEARDLLYYEREGYRRAKEEIKKDRKRAIREMTRAVAEEAAASQYISGRNLSRSAEPGEPDVRAYMDVRYGVLIDVATEQEEAINTTSSRTRTNSYLSQVPRTERKSSTYSDRHRSEEETMHRSHVGEKLCDSEVSSDSDSEPEIVLTLRPESRYHARYSSRESKDKHKREDTVTREDLFTIPRTEYISRTETYKEASSGPGSRDRERFLQQQERFVTRREEDLEEREKILRERELALLTRERQFIHRENTPGPRTRGYEEPPIIIQPHERAGPRYHDEGVSLRPERIDPRIRRAASYPEPSGPHFEFRQDFEGSDDESMYGRPIVEPPPPPPPEARRRPRRRSKSDSDDDKKEFIVQPRRR